PAVRILREPENLILGDMIKDGGGSRNKKGRGLLRQRERIGQGQ
ncbi:hypothetical protein CEXT_354751, partial [Caerostris extrusa]